MGVVDVFDAVTTPRPYKAARSFDEACRILRDEVRRGWRRTDLVETFIALLTDRGLMSRSSDPVTA